MASPPLSSVGSDLLPPDQSKPPQQTQSTSFRWWPYNRRPHHRTGRVQWRRSRRGLPVIRLGGGTHQKRRPLKFAIGNILRRIRLKWLKLQYSRAMKKLKIIYQGLIKDLIEASAANELLQQRSLMETSMVLPVMSVSFNAKNHYYAAGNGSRSVSKS